MKTYFVVVELNESRDFARQIYGPFNTPQEADAWAGEIYLNNGM